MVDVNKPVENPKLKALLQEFNLSRTDEVANALFEEIAMNAHFLSVILLTEEPEPTGDGKATFKSGTLMRFPLLTSGENRLFYPVFTDWVELGKWQDAKAPKTLILSFDDYASMVLENENVQGFAINPFSDNMVIDRRMIEHMKTQKEIIAKGVSQQTIAKDTEVQLGEPKNYPTEMANAISEHLKSQPAVQRVWLRLMKKGEEFSFLLVVDFSGDKRELFNGIATAARPYLRGMYLDIIPFAEGFGKSAVQNVEPFYRK